MLVVGFLATIMATVVAIAVGVTAGYLRGWKSESLSALSNVFLVIPGLPLMIIVASQFQNPPLWVIAAVLGFTGWAWGHVCSAHRRCPSATVTSSRRHVRTVSRCTASSWSRCCRTSWRSSPRASSAP
ncbi:hypothetical protein P9139_04690 [Curtobacterium flaccumfaciens]|nr:hypothetical protein P9139_04690 [Curtobacterium flaccumfaciens]